ncbi:TetR/AcrR family transcriptional regulator [Blastococcus goldschmidtiae]|uniref:Helix-turn-helix domain-containing protein n=1 Tax=Blastococcus goldschmidtiae TaxID=3075546 RepID=A0ABU2K2R1_9ACTN|nr:helix-turn-helix domain-containing protein [Blastococcus sp. DSM 46792]MDT0274356.1 helix-turn-helix domain-containing protein [Blastococcus sp. DSM 46792]
MTGTSDSRNRRWAATHRCIFTTALELFEDFGFEQVSVGRIAARSGVSVPTFYAHYPSKEHLVMAPPTVEEVGALLATQPPGLAVGERVLRANLMWIARMPPDEYDELATRWRIIATTPALRTRVAEYERATAGMILANLPAPSDTVQIVQATAALAATTAALLAWADGNGQRKLEELFDEAFRALSA